MKAYEKPTMEIVTFKQDVITASGDGDKFCDKICDGLCDAPDVCKVFIEPSVCADAK